MATRPTIPRLTVALLPILAAGCASMTSGDVGGGMPATVGGPEARVEETLPSVLSFPEASVDDLWRVLPGAFQALGIPAGIIDARARVYGNGTVTETSVAGKATRDLFRCAAGSGLSLGQYRVQFGISAQPRAAIDGGAELFVQTVAFGRMVSASRSGTTHCVSNGTLELKLKEQMDAELGRIGG